MILLTRETHKCLSCNNKTQMIIYTNAIKSMVDLKDFVIAEEKMYKEPDKLRGYDFYSLPSGHQEFYQLLKCPVCAKLNVLIVAGSDEDMEEVDDEFTGEKMGKWNPTFYLARLTEETLEKELNTKIAEIEKQNQKLDQDSKITEIITLVSEFMIIDKNSSLVDYLKTVVEEYKETVKKQLYLASMILASSILEVTLSFILEETETDTSLYELIQKAKTKNILSLDSEQHIKSIRYYRNLVHYNWSPTKKSYSIQKQTFTIVIQALELVAKDLQKYILDKDKENL
jgi:hypothetical protein